MADVRTGNQKIVGPALLVAVVLLAAAAVWWLADGEPLRAMVAAGLGVVTLGLFLASRRRS